MSTSQHHDQHSSRQLYHTYILTFTDFYLRSNVYVLQNPERHTTAGAGGHPIGATPKHLTVPGSEWKTKRKGRFSAPSVSRTHGQYHYGTIYGTIYSTFNSRWYSVTSMYNYTLRLTSRENPGDLATCGELGRLPVRMSRKYKANRPVACRK